MTDVSPAPVVAPHLHTRTQGGDMNHQLCTVENCTDLRVGMGMCARHLFAWAMRRTVKRDVA